jgi:hypothetical protein
MVRCEYCYWHHLKNDSSRSIKDPDLVWRLINADPKAQTQIFSLPSAFSGWSI